MVRNLFEQQFRTAGTGFRGEATQANDLTTAQNRLLRYLITAMTERQIATRLGQSHHTVHEHVRGLYSRLLRSDASLVDAICSNDIGP